MSARARLRTVVPEPLRWRWHRLRHHRTMLHGQGAAYFARLLLNIHVWSFRKPDAPEERTLQQRPGEVPGLPKPCWREIAVDDPLPNCTPVTVGLTRYRPEGAQARPVVLIHGYSSGGTTFAHHAVRPNLAEYLCNAKRDVWVLDLRTSIGMPTWREPWSFEQVAFADLPVAFEAICSETGAEKLDVFAHCMGAAMFSMAVLSDPPAGSRFAAQHDPMAWAIRPSSFSFHCTYEPSPTGTPRAWAASWSRRSRWTRPATSSANSCSG